MSFQEQVAGIIKGVLAKPEYNGAIESLQDRIKPEEKINQQVHEKTAQPDEKNIRENSGIEH